MVDIRTFEPLSERDLKEILRLAEDELRRFVEEVGQPPGKYRGYRHRLLAICLVQGAAQHFVDTRPELSVDQDVDVEQSKVEEKGYRIAEDGRVISGVKDIDVVFFFSHDGAVPIPRRNHCMKSIVRNLGVLGERKLDFMKKGVPFDVPGSDTVNGVVRLVRCYLEQTDHGRAYLSKKSIVGLYPAPVFGHPLWVTRRLTSRFGGRAAPAAQRKR